MLDARAHGTTQQGFDFVLEAFARLLVGSDDENGVVSGDGAGDLGKFGGVGGGGKRLGAARGRFENKKVFGGTDIQKKFGERAGKGRQRRSLFGQSGGGLVAFGSFDELQLLQIAGKGGLGDAEALLGQAAAKLFLIGDALGGNKPEDLTVAECFAGAHDCRNIHLPVFLYRARSTLVKSFFEMQERIANRMVSKWPMQDSHRFRDGHWIFWPR